MLNRRKFLAAAGSGGAALALPGPVIGRRAVSGPPAHKPFSTPLHVPPAAKPVRQDANTDYYRITMAATDVEIFPGVKTKAFTYAGEFPGPTIHARRGRKVVVTHTNHLDHPAVVHVHGMHGEARYDGYPMDVIEPGAAREYRYPNSQLGATLWYHDHAHHVEAENVYRGLAGFYLLADPAERALGLPEGEYDVPILLRDAEFDARGQLVFHLEGFRTRKTLLVNGRPQPYMRVAARKYRFRFLNGANERRFGLALADGATMCLIGSDGGLLPAPIHTKRFDVWPGERVEAVIDFGAYPVGTRLVLLNEFGEDRQTREVMRFDVVRSEPDPSRIPAALRALPDLGTPTVHRKVVFSHDRKTGMFLIDGKIFDMDRIDQHVKLGTTEIWTISNDDRKPPIPHNMHIHLVQFQVLDRNGKPVGGHETGLKDTVTVPNGGDVRIKVRFADYTGRYVYHCHLIDHSAMGMMAQLEIKR